MGKTIQFGLGFVTGRPNVCKVINNTFILGLLLNIHIDK